jgi:hypothetical protein
MKIKCTLEIEFTDVLHAGQEEYETFRHVSKKRFINRKGRHAQICALSFCKYGIM